MMITEIKLWRANLELSSPFGLSGGRVLDRLPSAIVCVTNADGLHGWGESCPWGADYVAAFYEAVEAGICVLAPKLIGQPADQRAQIIDLLQGSLRQQPSVWSALDMATADLAAKQFGIPMWQYLGGRRNTELELSAGIEQTPGDRCTELLERARQNRIRQMSAKATGIVDADIELVRFVLERLKPGEYMKLDANGGWTLRDAMRLAPHLDHRVVIEQPCATTRESLDFAKMAGHPVFLDETILGCEDLLEAVSSGGLAGVNLKIGRLGGLSPITFMRDLCLKLGLPMFIQDTGGSSIARAATAHVAAGVTASRLMSIWDCAAVLKDPWGEGGVRNLGHALAATDGPGLGIQPDLGLLGAPLKHFV